MNTKRSTPAKDGLRMEFIVTMGFILAVGTFSALSYFTYQTNKEQLEAGRLVTHTNEVLLVAQELLDNLFEAETAQRGFIISGDETFLKPYTNAIDSVGYYFKNLERLTSDNIEQKEKLKVLWPLIEQRLERLKDNIGLRRQSDSSVKVTYVLHGKALMTGIKKVLGEVKKVERSLLSERTRKNELQIESFANIYFTTVGIVGVLFVILFWVIYANIVTRRKAQDMLQKSLREVTDYKLALDESSIVAIADPSGIILHANDNFCSIAKYRRDELIGQDFRIINSGYHSGEFMGKLWKTIAGGEVWRGELKNKAKDGSIFWVDTTIVPFLDENMKPYQYIAIQHDITKRKAGEENIRLMNESLNEAKNLAEEANRTKSQFLANMSHEIRTPLNAVIGLSHLALQTDLSPKQLDYLQKIQSSSESLLSIINDILDFSKVESGKLTLEESSFDLEETFQNLANMITYKANTKGLEVAFGIDNNVPTYLIGDSGRLEQILINLCGNAVKFTHEGEVVVMVKVIEESSDKIKLKFEVSDTGIGMDGAQVSRLFQPFTQADDTISRKYGGTGLGLSIIKKLVELMEGEVWVDSIPGRGSHFYFTIWLKRQAIQRKIPVPSIDLRKLNVLLVDDSRPARDILRAGLESLSFQVTAVGSGIQAIHYLKNNYHHNPVKVVLLDWNMPEMDGIETARIIRQDEQLSKVKIIMLCTSYASEELYTKTETLNLSGILIKPIRYSRLYDMMMRVIENGNVRMSTSEMKKALHGDETKLGEKRQGHVLLVEDNEINQQVAVELLEGFGFSVELAANGLEAVEKVQASGTPSKFDLLLMDLQMPVMGGRKATTEIRKLESYRNLPIIAMTADAMVSVKEDCLAAGMNDFITKPINPHKMLETIERWLGHGEVRSYGVEQGTKEQIRIPALDGVDVEDGLLHLGGNMKLYKDLMRQFAEKHTHFVEEVERHFQSGDVTSGRRMIHSLKGVSGNLGMKDLHTLCKTLEARERMSPSTDLAGMIRPVAEELDRILEAIRKANFGKEVPFTALAPGEIREKLGMLAHKIKESDPEAIRILDEIGVIPGFEEEFNNLRKALSTYNFDEASNHVRMIHS